MNYNKETHRWEFPPHSNLASAVKRFFEILDYKEVSNNDVEFNPVRMDTEDRKIDSCRVMLTAELEDLLPQMKRMANE